ncbi:MAG TPA: hypothetical protein VJ954_00780 [Ignavibacteriaceae bacterium]|nr:hypothetical protein [Ignavibacteriaceae bacterium]
MHSNLFTKYSFPSYFKIIGLVVILISMLVLIFAALIKSYIVVFPVSNIILMYNRLSFLCGLSLVIFSREREENEETDKARLVALIFSMAASILLLIIIEIINVFSNNSPIYAVDFMIIEMCIYYIKFKFK